MNERVMQFRIGMFVIVAGLVLTMLVVWFGESPTLFRSQKFLIVHYPEAPGVSEGIPVRKSGIRIGEVAAIRFDDRPGKGDGVLVTLALDPKYKIRDGSVPRVSRALIGDVAIDMTPGTGDGNMVLGGNAKNAPIIEGAVAPDPANALAAATDAFQNVKGTLESIDAAAKGLAVIAKKAENIDEFLATYQDTGKKIGTLAADLDKVAKASEADFPAVVSNLRQLSDKLNTTLDAKMIAEFKTTSKQLADGSARLDKILMDVGPLARDLGQDQGKAVTTSIGQTVSRLNRISYEMGLLTAQLSNGKGGLNPNGSIQRLVISAELYENYNKLALTARDVMGGAKSVLANFNKFAERIANDPSAISRGVLQR